MNEEKDVVIFNPTVILEDDVDDDIHGNTDTKYSTNQGEGWD